MWQEVIAVSVWVTSMRFWYGFYTHSINASTFQLLLAPHCQGGREKKIKDHRIIKLGKDLQDYQSKFWPNTIIPTKSHNEMPGPLTYWTFPGMVTSSLPWETSSCAQPLLQWGYFSKIKPETPLMEAEVDSSCCLEKRDQLPPGHNLLSGSCGGQ